MKVADREPDLEDWKRKEVEFHRRGKEVLDTQHSPLVFKTLN
jgi:hypothetical protein